MQPLRDLYPNRLLTELEKEDLDKLVNQLLDGKSVKRRKDGTPGKCRSAWKPVTVNVMLRRTTTMLQSYVDQGKLVRNVGRLVDRVPGGSVYKKFETYSAAELERVLTEADRDRRGHAWHLALSGLRRGEVSGLRWTDVDLVAGTLTITPGHNRTIIDGKVYEGGLKTDNSQRTLPLPPELLRVLKAAKKRQAEEKLRAGAKYDGSGGYVVCDELGGPYYPNTLSKAWLALCRKVGVKRLRLHDARHTCGTLLHLQGVPVAIIAAWLGHVDGSFTMKVYVRPNTEELARARDAMQAISTPKAAMS